jgi:large subunit ribosomal protein L13
MEKDPTEVIRKAVLRMLPRNRLRDVSETSFLFHSAFEA